VLITLLGNLGMFGPVVPVNRIPVLIVSDVHTGLGIDSLVQTGINIRSDEISELQIDSRQTNNLRLGSRITTNF